jgi:hypothetical protein
MQRKGEMQTWLDLAEIDQDAVSTRMPFLHKETACRRNMVAGSPEGSDLTASKWVEIQSDGKSVELFGA